MTASTGDPGATAGARRSPTESGQGDIPADTFAARLLLARHHAGHLSIREAADQCGLGRGAWTNWERGARPYDKVDIAQRVSDALGINFDWLLLGGPLLPARGRPAKRTQPVTGEYQNVSEWGHGRQPNGRPRMGAIAQAVRRARLISRAQLVAA